MSKHTISSRIRDILIFILLVLLVRFALQRNAKEGDKPFVIHEIDPQMATYLTQALQQFEHYLKLPMLSDDDVLETTAALERIENIEKKYMHTSPAIALLGPLGTTSVVLKERNLENQLLHELNELGRLMHERLGYREPFRESASIQKALNANQRLLSLIQKK